MLHCAYVTKAVRRSLQRFDGRDVSARIFHEHLVTAARAAIGPDGTVLRGTESAFDISLMNKQVKFSVSIQINRLGAEEACDAALHLSGVAANLLLLVLRRLHAFESLEE